MEEERVILVDSRDNILGEAPKLQAHLEGRLHRAVSVFIRNPTGDVLLQRRAEAKYHSAGLWSNACCTHPRPDETPHHAANRRLAEEMGLTCELRHRFSFLYRAELDGGLIEHELDHVFTGVTDATPRPDPAEVGEWRWISLPALEAEIASSPERFTAWLPLLVERVRAAEVAPES